jgi:hypothetical protein
MNKQASRENNNEPSILEDLTITQSQAAEVKGGPIFMQYHGIDGDVTAAGHEKWIEMDGGPVSGGSSLKRA